MSLQRSAVERTRLVEHLGLYMIQRLILITVRCSQTVLVLAV